MYSKCRRSYHVSRLCLYLRDVKTNTSQKRIPWRGSLPTEPRCSNKSRVFWSDAAGDSDGGGRCVMDQVPLVRSSIVLLLLMLLLYLHYAVDALLAFCDALALLLFHPLDLLPINTKPQCIVLQGDDVRINPPSIKRTRHVERYAEQRQHQQSRPRAGFKTCLLARVHRRKLQMQTKNTA